MSEYKGLNLPTTAEEIAALFEEWLLDPLKEERVRDLVARVVQLRKRFPELQQSEAFTHFWRMITALNIAKQCAEKLEPLLAEIEARS